MKKLNHFVRILFITFFVLTEASCGGNFFKAMSTSTTDDAKYDDALKSIDSGDYATAITLIEGTTAGFLATTKVRETLAGAYAGKCGLDFISMISGLSSSSGAPLLFFMQAFQNTTVSPADCATAQLKMELIGNSSQRTADQNLFMFVLGIAKLGTYLKARADSNSDGASDQPHISCGNQGPPYMSDGDINQIVTGLGLIFDNIASVGASISGSSAVVALDAFKSTCELLTGITNCAVTDPNSASITAGTRLVFRELIQTSDFGIESSCTTAQIGTPMGAGTVCCP